MSEFNNIGPTKDDLIFKLLGPSTTGPLSGVVKAESGERATWYGVGGFARTDFAGGATVVGNGVAVFGVALVNADDAAAWGANFVVADYPDNSSTQTGVGRQVIGAEFDLSTYSPHSIVEGIGMTGSCAAQPAAATAFQVGDLSTQSVGLARWTTGVAINDGTIKAGFPAIVVGAVEKPADDKSIVSQTSQDVWLGWIDSAGDSQVYRLFVDSTGTLNMRTTGGAGAGLNLDGTVVVTGTFGAAATAFVNGAFLLPNLIDAADDAGAAAAGVVVGQCYRSSSAVMVRVA